MDVRGNRVGNDTKDIRDMQFWDLGDEKVDVVFHLASFCKINRCIAEPYLPFEHNVKGTFSVMEFCRRNNIGKVVFTSSTRVLYPEKNPYTASKMYGEELVKSYAETYGMKYVIVRPSTVYGPHADPTNRLLTIWIKAALAGKPLMIFGDENKTLDFTYVDDFVTALNWATKFDNKEFNIGSGNETKLIDVANFIIDEVGGGSVEFHEPEQQQPQQVVVDTDFPCETLLAEGIKRTVDFWR